MTLLAVAGTGYFEADDREVVRSGWTYTIDTLESLGDEEVVLIVGADTALGLPTWHRYEEVLARATVAVMPRPGIDRDAVDALLAEHFWLDSPELPISGTILRQRAAEGASIRFLVPDLVHDYIERHGLYG